MLLEKKNGSNKWILLSITKIKLSGNTVILIGKKFEIISMYQKKFNEAARHHK